MRDIIEIIEDFRTGKELSEKERPIVLAYIQGKYDAIMELKIDKNSNFNEKLDKKSMKLKEIIDVLEKSMKLKEIIDASKREEYKTIPKGHRTMDVDEFINSLKGIEKLHIDDELRNEILEKINTSIIVEDE